MTEKMPLEKIVEAYVSDVRKDLAERLDRWKIDFALGQFNEVVGGLLARQVTLACELGYSPNIWNGHTAPLVLRAMADVFIAVAWIIRSPLERSSRFVLFGLGQQKLQLAHRRAELEGKAPTEDELAYVEALENMLRDQRIPDLTEVELGNWGNTRSMAEEAGHLDFYNYVYSPFSACTHSMWHHISLYNLSQCTNPLHKRHRAPAVFEPTIDPHYLYLAAKYVNKTFREFDGIVDVGAKSAEAFDKLCERLSVEDEDNSGTEINGSQ
jgi:hypothetical protein